MRESGGQFARAVIEEWQAGGNVTVAAERLAPNYLIGPCAVFRETYVKQGRTASGRYALARPDLAKDFRAELKKILG